MSITYEMDWSQSNYSEMIFSDGEYIGEINGSVLEGYELRKFNVIEPIAYFQTVCDAKDFVNQAGRL